MDNEITEVPPEPQLQLSSMAKIAGIFLDPRRTFESLVIKPDFIVPLILVVLISLVFTIVAWPVIEKESIEAQRTIMEDRGLSEEQIESAIRTQKEMGKYFGYIGAPISVIISTLIISGILLFMGNVLIGGASKFKNVLSIFAYSSLIDIPSYTIKLILVMNKGTLKVYTSLALFFPQSAEDTMLFKLAAVFDIFVIWQVIVISIGMAALYKCTTQKALTLVGTLFILFNAARIIIGGAF